MDDTAFVHLVTNYLDQLLETIESKYWEVVECELNSGVLNIKTQSGKEFVVNRNIPRKELWLSSPFSGGAHFYPKDGQWFNTRTESSFEPLIFNELDKLKI